MILFSLSGMAIYFLYGIRHSVEDLEEDENENENFIVPDTPEIDQEVSTVQPGGSSVGSEETIPLKESFQHSTQDPDSTQ